MAGTADDRPFVPAPLRGRIDPDYVRAVIKAVPYIGESLDFLLFERLNEDRFDRIERTLAEVGKRLEELDVPQVSPAEEFGNLLEEIAPALTRAINEDKRARFRDLLVNAATVSGGSTIWAEANLASRLIVELDPAALAVLAAIERFGGVEPANIVSRPEPQIVPQEDWDWDSPTAGDCVIGYSWPVVEEWCRRLKERRLMQYQSVDARGGFGRVALADLGKVLIRWATQQHDG